MEARGSDDPVDKDERFMRPHTVDAHYNPAYKEIIFLAFIMQSPFCDYKVDAAVNYSNIGAAIGLEISHEFDDQGSPYDKDGNLRSWWTDEDRTAFVARTKRLSDQYAAYEPPPSVKADGDLTLGEDIDDLGSVNVAYGGLQLHLSEHGRPGEIDRFVPEQRFFISWGTIWRTKYRNKALEIRSRPIHIVPVCTGRAVQWSTCKPSTTPSTSRPQTKVTSRQRIG